MLLRVVFLICLLQATFFCGLSQPDSKFLIKAGKVFDAEKKTWSSDQFIFVEKDRIVKITASDKALHPGYKIIDLSGNSVIPGLIDAHTHFLFMQKSGSKMEEDILQHSDQDRLLRGAGIARSFLMAGITSVRDLGNSGQYLDAVLKNAINKGWVQGSRMFISGPIICPPGGQFGKLDQYHKDIPEKEYSIVRTPGEAGSITYDHIVRGVDVIKICATNDNGRDLSIEEMKAIVAMAHSKNIKVTAHATYDKVIRNAIEAGVDGIEHGYNISDSTLLLMAQKNIYLVPTDGTFDGYKGIAETGGWKVTDAEIKEFTAAATERLKRAVKLGVKIVYGSDLYLYTPRSIGLEAKNTLMAYYEAGLPVNDVLQIATLNPATILGKQGELGVLKAGAIADIVAFKGDLEKNFKTLLYDNVSFVMKAGNIIPAEPPVYPLSE